jgi:N-acetyl-anhydromuramyl-L-alanine amidase AmpD
MSREIKQLIIHCADTPASMDIGAAVINQWHKARGWSAIGYHWVIKRDGTIEPGRDLDGDGDVIEEVGAHAKGFNANSLAVCLVGGKGGFNYTSAQMRSLNFLIDDIESRYPDIEVLGHCDLPNVDKECPCFNVRAWRSNE